MQRFLVWLGMILFLAVWAPGVLPQEGSLFYTATQSGKPVGTLRMFWDGRRLMQAALSNPKGIVVFQDRVDQGRYASDIEEDGKVKHVDFPIDPKWSLLDLKHLHYLLFVKSNFPIRQGETARLQLMDPETRERFPARVESLGAEIRLLQKNKMKLIHDLLDLKGVPVNVYLDQDKKMVLVDVPSREFSLELTDPAPVSFPIENWELKGESDCCSREEIEIESIGGKALSAEMVFPAKGTRLPGALLFGPQSEAEFLNALAYHLASRHVAGLVYAPAAGEHPMDGSQDANTLFRFFRRQTRLDPGRMIVIGFESGAKGAAALAATRKDLAAALFLSPDVDFFETVGEFSEALEKQETPVALFQGEAESLVNLDAARAWVARTNRNRQAEKVSWIFLPRIGHDFLSQGPVSRKFQADSASKKVDSAVIEAITGWLSAHSLTEP